MGKKRMQKLWVLPAPTDVECPVEHVAVSNTGHIVIKLKGDGGHVVQEISDGLDGPTWLNVPVAFVRELVIRVRAEAWPRSRPASRRSNE